MLISIRDEGRVDDEDGKLPEKEVRKRRRALLCEEQELLIAYKNLMINLHLRFSFYLVYKIMFLWDEQGSQ